MSTQEIINSLTSKFNKENFLATLYDDVNKQSVIRKVLDLQDDGIFPPGYIEDNRGQSPCPNEKGLNREDQERLVD